MNVRFDLIRTDVHLSRKEEGEYEKILHGIMSSAFKISFYLFYVLCSIQLSNVTKLRVGT